MKTLFERILMQRAGAIQKSIEGGKELLSKIDDALKAKKNK
jgi:hypothetical protein